MQAFGSGAQQWRVRAAVIADGTTSHDMEAVVRRLRDRLADQAGEPDSWGVSGELGPSEIGKQVLGAGFWVAADDVGSAAVTAVETLAAACSYVIGREHPLYEVSVVPRSATISPAQRLERNDPSIGRLRRLDP